MTEHPIVLRDWEVRAFLAGKKTQLRRPIKPQPPSGIEKTFPVAKMRGDAAHWHASNERDFPMWAYHIPCPFGSPGDTLIGKETWSPDCVNVEAAIDLNRNPVHYRADGEAPSHLSLKWRSAVTLPRWASRLTLVVERVRAERAEVDYPEEKISSGQWYWALDVRVASAEGER